ncbi:MAG: hypothetical protein Ct9H300mP25_06100 [Acidobacteriota bacterium]|nr:MAG: hypothetical protein Ct9H300mP25_06100 [Acidobacteriota bacterium]
MKQVDVPATQFVPNFNTEQCCLLIRQVVSADRLWTMIIRLSTRRHGGGGVQREVIPGTVVEVFYMGSYTFGGPTIRRYIMCLFLGGVSISSRRDIPALSGIRAIRFDGTSIYHAVTFKAERRLRDNVALNTAYTLSRSRDDASSPGATAFESNVPQNVRDIFPGEQALSSFDHRHQFVGQWNFLNSRLCKARGGWQEDLFGNWRINGVVTIQSGAPFTVNLVEAPCEKSARARAPSVRICQATRICRQINGLLTDGLTRMRFLCSSHLPSGRLLKTPGVCPLGTPMLICR